jgi:hypothetical protein
MTPQNSGTAEKFDGHGKSCTCTPAKCVECRINDGEPRQDYRGMLIILCLDCWWYLYRY